MAWPDLCFWSSIAKAKVAREFVLSTLVANLGLQPWHLFAKLLNEVADLLEKFALLF